MIEAFVPVGNDLERVRCDSTSGIDPNAVWIDLLRPTRDEEATVEALIGAELLTREEMEEIEPSSRLSFENGVIYLTAALLCRSESSDPGTTAVSFILAGDRLVTLRYDEPGTIAVALARLLKPNAKPQTGVGVLVTLLEAAIDRLADVLEHSSDRTEAIGRHIFEAGTEHATSVDYRAALRNIGREGIRLGHIQESLTSLSRLLLFLSEKSELARIGSDGRARLKTMLRDVQALVDHGHGLEDRTTFLLDATLGLVGIQQNSIIKIFSVLAVIFMPPTLVASIYGMNFDVMPELHWTLGYPFALLFMVASAVVTFVVFRWRGWL
ncbi:magnesium transporter CorA family protein [Chthonobacter albigriseus]|uniref:magnesium transporter CorA family protein n=1 Tax=Chthonobacter albigriseus TaxID=1683161 RepID=UPI0015EF8592|nr:magnesium transporter CorA family protein [Chthonobacter albigriseus]